jgi:uncharacterized protein
MALRENRTLIEVLGRAAAMNLNGWYLVATVACLRVRLEPGGRWRVYAPFGLSDVFNLVARPNPVLAPRHVYQGKTDRWRRQWPGLTVLPWPEGPVAT